MRTVSVTKIITLFFMSAILTGCKKASFNYDVALGYEILSSGNRIFDKINEVVIYDSRRENWKRNFTLSNEDKSKLVPLIRIKNKEIIKALVDHLRVSEGKTSAEESKNKRLYDTEGVYHLFFVTHKKNLGYIRVLIYDGYSYVKPFSPSNSVRYNLEIGSYLKEITQ